MCGKGAVRVNLIACLVARCIAVRRGCAARIPCSFCPAAADAARVLVTGVRGVLAALALCPIVFFATARCQVCEDVLILKAITLASFDFVWMSCA